MDKDIFKKLINDGKYQSIDFKSPNGIDHEYINKLGYNINCNYDCTFTVKELPGLSLSSYGNWGTIHTNYIDNTTKDVIYKMIDNNIIFFFREN